MSMLSAQIDELRAMAQLEKNLERPAIARILDDAADTIWELRDDLQRANTENAKLGKQYELVIVDYRAEVAKLRKLALDVHALHWSGLDCTECPWIGECDTDGGCPWLGIMRDHMRDLGIEVDG